EQIFLFSCFVWQEVQIIIYQVPHHLYPILEIVQVNIFLYYGFHDELNLNESLYHLFFLHFFLFLLVFLVYFNWFYVHLLYFFYIMFIIYFMILYLFFFSIIYLLFI